MPFPNFNIIKQMLVTLIISRESYRHQMLPFLLRIPSLPLVLMWCCFPCAPALPAHKFLPKNKSHLINKLHDNMFLLDCNKICFCTISRIYFPFNIFLLCYYYGLNLTKHNFKHNFNLHFASSIRM